MPCVLNSGITKACRDAAPGLTTVYVTEFSNYTQGTITSASGIITNTVSFLNSTKKFWVYELEMGVGSEVENINPDSKTGTLAIAQNLNFYIPKKQASIAQQVMLLAQQDLLFIVKDRNGKYRLLGQEFGMRITTATAASGAMGNDDSGYTIVLTGEERTFANVVPSALAALLLIPA